MKKLFTSFILLIAFITLVGCSKNDNELKTVSMFGGTDPHATTYNNLIKEFEEENDIKVDDNSATSDETWKTSINASFKSGTEPDVLFYFTGSVAKPIVDNGYVVSVKDIRKEYPDYAKNISENTLDPYAVPLKGFVEGLFVNKALFTGDLAPYLEKDNWTWDEFLEISDKLNAKNITPVALGAKDVPHYWIEHLILSMNGKEAFTNIPKESDITASNGWVKALQLFKTLDDAKVFGPKGVAAAQANELASQNFKDGKAAMILDGSWFAGQINDETVAKQSEVMMMPFPSIPTSMGGKGESYLQSGFTSGFYITKKAWDNPDKREAAVKFVEKMTSTAAVTEFCKSGGGAPADASAKIPDLTPLGQSMNDMFGRTKATTLPLSDACKANTFPGLVTGATKFFGGDANQIIEVLKSFSKAQ